MDQSDQIIPDNESGVATNTESAVELDTEQEARSFFQIVRHRLLQVNRWHHYAGKATADFQLADAQGNDVDRTVQQGDHFKIDIPGPGSKTGEGHDWVQVEKIADEEDAVAITVRPVTNPQNDRRDVAHFFSAETTSSFMVRREKNRVIAGVYGRNEKPNLDAETTVDKLRNVAVAGGAISGFSKLQWKSLVNGLVEKD